MKSYGRREVKLHAFLTEVLNGDEWSAPLSGLFSPEERTFGAFLTGAEWALESI